MIRILIIEDEIPARQKLKRYLATIKTPHKVVAEFQSVQESLDFLAAQTVDLIFSDIELIDGIAFDIFKETKITCPLIFTTAYDQFWMNAFETNGIDYLLKPYSQTRFQQAWTKFEQLKSSKVDEENWLTNMNEIIQSHLGNKTYKQRFTISSRNSLILLETADITQIFAEDGVIFAMDYHGQRHALSLTTLKELEDQLDPNLFFKINRGVLIQKKFIEKIEKYGKNTFAIYLKNAPSTVTTSETQTPAFRKWLEN